MNDWQAAGIRRSGTAVARLDPDRRPTIRPRPIREIEKRADDWRFCQIQLGSKTSEPIGRRRYWPIFEAAMKHGFSIGLHVGGTQSSAPSPGGWPQFYIEDHQMLTHSMMNQATSLILEGVFDRYPGPEGRDDRGRVRLGAATRLAAGRALVEDARARFRICNGNRRST